jgi:hypothetical protein
VLAGSSSGADHDRAAISSQDAHAAEEIDGTLVVAVADGAGSAPLAATGSALAVSLAVRELRRLLAAPGAAAQDPQALLRVAARRTLRRFHRSLAALAHGAGLPARDFGTTLTVLLARPPWVAVYAVGDGFVVTRAGPATYDLFLAPPRGAGVPLGATTLLPVRGGLAGTRRRVARIPGLSGVAVGTDGLETLVIEFAGGRPARPAAEPFTHLFGLADDPDTNASALTRMLAGRRVGDLSTDDRTLVLAVPR